MDRKTPQTLKGFRDFLPDTMRARIYILDIIREIFEEFGFEPLETPSLEYAETLLGKYSTETDKETYIFTDNGGRKVGLIYDSTVPVARVLAQNYKRMVFPFKRYQIQRYYRAEKPQKGRYREFMQADIDIFGLNNPASDAEVISCAYRTIEKLGLSSNFYFLLNDREGLAGMLEKVGIGDKKRQLSALRSIDKMDKLGKGGVERELIAKRFNKKVVQNLLSALNNVEPTENLKEIIKLSETMGVPGDKMAFSPSLSRGSDYYTGMIIEGKVKGVKIGSIIGGGRYDSLIKSLGGPDIPATGLSIGIDRIYDALKELNLLENKTFEGSAEVLVTVFPSNEADFFEKSAQIADMLRKKGIRTELYLSENKPISKQIKYALVKKIPYVAILGPDEIEKGIVTLKNLKTKKQTQVKTKDLKKAIFTP